MDIPKSSVVLPDAIVDTLDSVLREYVGRAVRLNPDGSIMDREANAIDDRLAPFGYRIARGDDLRTRGATLWLVPLCEGR